MKYSKRWRARQAITNSPSLSHSIKLSNAVWSWLLKLHKQNQSSEQSFLFLFFFFLGERKTFTFGRSTETEENARKILCLLTKYLIKQKYVAAKSTQKAMYKERERENIFCILTHAGRKAEVKLTTHTYTLGMHVCMWTNNWRGKTSIEAARTAN